MHQWRPCGTRACLILLLLTAGFAFHPGAADTATLSLGEINPLTGRFAAHGTALHRGIQLAVEEANASGTLRVTLATRDDEARPDRAVAAAEELITRLRVAALVGGYVDTLVGPVSEVAERQKVPYVATASLDERLTQRGYRYFFRISHLQAYVDSMVGILQDVFKPQSVAILFSATPGASQLARRQRERLEQARVRVPVFEMFTSGIADFTPLLTRVRDSGAEVLIADTFFADHLVMVRQLRALEVNLKAFLGAFGMEFPEVVRDLGPSGQFLFGTTGWEPGITEPGTEAASRAFVDGYRRRFGTQPPPLAMHGYVGARAILAAAERAASRGREVGPETVRLGLQGLDLTTPLQRLQFDSRGEAKHYRRLIVQIQGSTRVVVYPPQRATGKPVYPMPAWKER
ncbi:MAG: ABC transporter substrate-binding protein [candidate division NC10 bacterium]|nr:ABC transporter substrate-binding protein [candidate division NC10 bacterium]